MAQIETTPPVTPIDAALLDLNLSSRRSDEVAEPLDGLGSPFAFIAGYTRAQLPPQFQTHPFVSKPLTQKLLIRTLKILERDVSTASRPAIRR